MDADDKENIEIGSVFGGDGSRVRKMEDDQNKRREMVNRGKMPEAVDLSVEKKTSSLDEDGKEERWVQDPQAQGSDEDDVFFGDVTNKELKKAKKYVSRRTAVYVPGFRMDRRLMRYTMAPQNFKLGEENLILEEIDETDSATSDSSTSQCKTKGNGQNEVDENEIKHDQCNSELLDNISQGIEKVSITETHSETKTASVSEIIVQESENNEITADKCAEKCPQKDNVSSLMEKLHLNGASDDKNNIKAEDTENGSDRCHIPHLIEGCDRDNSKGLPGPSEDSYSNKADTVTTDSCSPEQDQNEETSHSREKITKQDSPPPSEQISPSTVEPTSTKSESQEPVIVFAKINKEDELELDSWGNKPVPVDPAWYTEDCSDSDSDDFHEIVIRARLRSPFLTQLVSDSDEDSDSDSDSGSEEDSESDEESDEEMKADDGLEPDLRHLITEVINESMTEFVDVEPDCPLLICDDEHQGVIIEELTGEEEEELGEEDSNTQIVTKISSEDPQKDPQTLKGEINTEKTEQSENENNSNSNDSGYEKNDEKEPEPKKNIIQENQEFPSPVAIKTDETEENSQPEITETKSESPSRNTEKNLIQGEVLSANVKPSHSVIRVGPSTAKAEVIEILPIIADDKAMAIDTIVARAADNEEINSALALPELNVEDVIDLLQENIPLHRPQHLHRASNNSFNDSGPSPRRNHLGDNTVVVASTNRLGNMPVDVQEMYRILPEIQNKIDSTHTVASVTGPISSPGAPRSARKYRSIYASLPADDPIEIETQVVKDCVSDDFMTSFTKLDMTEDEDTHSHVEDSSPPPQSVNLSATRPVDKVLSSIASQLSSAQSNPFSVLKKTPQVRPKSDTVAVANTPSLGVERPVHLACTDNAKPPCSLANAMKTLSCNLSSSCTILTVDHSDEVMERRNSLEHPKSLNLTPKIGDRRSLPGDAIFSPSLVFKERNFSPILEVRFPPSPPIIIPSVQPPPPPKSPYQPPPLPQQQQPPRQKQVPPQRPHSNIYSRIVSRDKKRKQPSDEAHKPTNKPVNAVRKNHPISKTKTGPSPKRLGVPKTPPKKVIGQPNVHKFNTPLSASRSLFHKHCVHLSPRLKAKGTSHSSRRVPHSEPRPKSKPLIARSKTPTPQKPSKSFKSKPPNSAPRIGHVNNPSLVQHINPGRSTTHGPRPHHNSHSKHRNSPKSNQKTKTITKNPGSFKASQTPKTSSRKLFTPTKPTVAPSPKYTLTPVRIETVTPVKTPSSGSHKPRAVLGRRTPGSLPQDIPDFAPLDVGSPEVRSGSGDSSCLFPIDDSNVSSSRRKRAGGQILVIDSYGTLSPLRPDLIQGPGGDGMMKENQGALPVYKDGTPRFPANFNELFLNEKDGIYSEPPPPFHLYDLDDLDSGLGTEINSRDASRESSPRLSMEDVLERKRQQMMNLRAEKRKIQDIISKQGTPSVKTQRPNNSISYSAQPQPRFNITHTLSLSDEKLDAVTQVHTLCNSQRAVKVIHKGRALAIRQTPQSPHLPGRLSWNDARLSVDVEEERYSRGSTSPTAVTPPKPILAKKEPGFVYPFNDEPSTPVVVFRSRNSDRFKPSRSPRID